MRKTFIYLAILAVLVTGIYYFLIADHGSQFSDKEAGFNFKDTAAIGKLFLASQGGETILLERTDSGWMVNKQYRALPSTLDALLATLNTQQPLAPVVKAAYENAVKSLSTGGIKVEVYGRDSKKIRVFYVGGPSVNQIGTNMMVEGASTPYVVQAPGFNGYLTPRYTTQLSDWRDRTVFSIPAADIKSISVQYPDQPLKSFVISRENGAVIVKGDSSVTKGLGEPNMHNVNAYLNYFGNINCEGFLNGVEDMDSTIKNSPKQSTIDIETMSGKRQHVDIYWMAINRRSKNRETSNPDVPDEYDADRLYAVLNNYKDTMMIQHYVFRKIFRQTVEFYQRDAPGKKPDNNRPQQTNVIMHKNM